MSEENKTGDAPYNPFEFSMMFEFGFKLGQELGSLKSRLALAERNIEQLTATVDELKSRLAAKPRQD